MRGGIDGGLCAAFCTLEEVDGSDEGVVCSIVSNMLITLSMTYGRLGVIGCVVWCQMAALLVASSLRFIFTSS